jgi:type I restriction enzyme S subunit
MEVNKETLPKGWTIAKFEDLLDYIQPTNYIVKSTDYKDTYPTPVLTAGKSFIKGYTNETEGIFTKLPTIIFDDFTTATQFVNFPFKVKSSAMKILQPTCDLVNIKLAFYYMQTIRLKGETHKRFWISEYSQIPVPLAPLNEQKRILAKLEQVLTDLDKGIEYLETTQKQIRVYRQAVLQWAFEGKLTNKHVKENELPKGWKWSPISEVISELNQGWSPKCETTNSTSNDEWAVIKTSAIQHINFIELENKRLPKHLIPRKQHELKNNDILITRAGPRIRVGVCCLVKNVRPKLLNCDKAYRIIADESKVLPVYLVQVLNTPRFLKIIDKCKTGGSDSGLNLTQTRFTSIEIPLPKGIEVQRRIISEIESRLSVCDKIEETIESSLQQALALRLSIIKKAFEGKLVPQDPNDESAEKLLERIKAVKGKPEKKEKMKAEKKPAQKRKDKIEI